MIFDRDDVYYFVDKIVKSPEFYDFMDFLEDFIVDLIIDEEITLNEFEEFKEGLLEEIHDRVKEILELKEEELKDMMEENGGEGEIIPFIDQ